MSFQIGDRIIHQAHGPGTITGIEQKSIAGDISSYYVVETGQLTLWVGLASSDRTIRHPLSQSEFQDHLRLLCDHGEDLPDPHRERQRALADRIKKGAISEICRILRDLTARAKTDKLNKNDREVLRSARDLLLNEWELVANIDREKAEAELERLLLCQQNAAA